MGEKRSYTTREIANMCRAYNEVGNRTINAEEMKKYESIVPQEIRDTLFDLRNKRSVLKE